MTKIRSAFLLAAIVGCGSTSSEPGHPTGPCASPSGAYLFHMAPRSGNCGPIADQIITFDNITRATVSDCQSANMTDADNCGETVHVICPVTDTNGNPQTLEEQGAVHSGDNASSTITGIYTITITYPDGALYCQGTYDVTYTRQ